MMQSLVMYVTDEEFTRTRVVLADAEALGDAPGYVPALLHGVVGHHLGLEADWSGSQEGEAGWGTGSIDVHISEAVQNPEGLEPSAVELAAVRSRLGAGFQFLPSSPVEFLGEPGGTVCMSGLVGPTTEWVGWFVDGELVEEGTPEVCIPTPDEAATVEVRWTAPDPRCDGQVSISARPAVRMSSPESGAGAPRSDGCSAVPIRVLPWAAGLVALVLPRRRRRS